MKIAVSAGAQGLSAHASPIFGRCQYFVIAEIDGGEIISDQTIENTARDQTRGAGSSAAQLLAEKDVDALVTGKVGMTSFMALQQLDVSIYEKSTGTVGENIKKYIAGELTPITSATGGAGQRRTV